MKTGGELLLACMLALTLPAAAQTHASAKQRKHTAVHHTAHRRPARRRSPRPRITRVRREMEPSRERSEQIQKALIAAGYLDHASGHWDAATVRALRQYQIHHHWQTRYVPDARALIALGLGPPQDALPPATAAINADQALGLASPGERADPPRQAAHDPSAAK